MSRGVDCRTYLRTKLRSTRADTVVRAQIRNRWQDAEQGVVFTCLEIAEATGGRLVREGPPGTICTDSRTLTRGAWFIALRGPNFDGQEYLPQAEARGCSGAVGQVAPPDWQAGFVETEDGLRALQDLASSVRGRFDGHVVAITGSTGKTTTRAMISLALAPLGHIHQTSGNLNNHIGVPLTLLAMPSSSAACVLELGMSHLGEIRQLAAIVRPSVRLVLNVGPVHIEGCGSLEGVAQAKGELFQMAQPGDTCLVNMDDALVAGLSIPEGVRFGRHPESDVRLMSAEPTLGGLGVRALLETSGAPPARAAVELHTPGLHLALNACAAAAVAVALGVPLEAAASGIEKYRPVGMRLKLKHVWLKAGGARAQGARTDDRLTSGHSPGVHPAVDMPEEPVESPPEGDSSSLSVAERVPGGGSPGSKPLPVVLINDAYNANPMSMRAALELLACIEGEASVRRLAVLGDMLELGDASREAHARILSLCEELRIHTVGICGTEFCAAYDDWQASRGSLLNVVRADDSATMAEHVSAILEEGDIVLVKGSRGMKMEEVCNAIEKLNMSTSYTCVGKTQLGVW
eukprot:jgi/Mesen1/9043/ME000057S08460